MDIQRRFENLMRQVRNGSEIAAREMVQTYGTHILRIIRRKMNKRLRTQFDSSDFEQTVWASFFAIPLHQLVFATSEALLAFLAGVARNQMTDVYRQYARFGLLNINQERHLEGSAAAEADNLLADDPSPSQQAVAKDNFSHWKKKVSRKHYAILDMLRDGYTHAEIAATLGVNEKTIRRLTHRLAAETTE